MLGQIQLRHEIAARLKQTRIDAGFATPEQFCLENRLNLKTYLRHESGSIALRASAALVYAKALKVTIQWLMLGNLPTPAEMPGIKFEKNKEKQAQSNSSDTLLGEPK